MAGSSRWRPGFWTLASFGDPAIHALKIQGFYHASRFLCSAKSLTISVNCTQSWGTSWRGTALRLTNFLTARSARLDHFSASTSSEHLRQAAHIPDPLLKRGSPLHSKFSHWYPLNAGEVLQKSQASPPWGTRWA